VGFDQDTRDEMQRWGQHSSTGHICFAWEYLREAFVKRNGVKKFAVGGISTLRRENRYRVKTVRTNV
ncbi:MAG: hypothetical protein WAL52_22575, partial [Candidatus Sulfotelmatobacter sp.]